MPRDRRKKHATVLTFFKTEAQRNDAMKYGLYTYCGRKVSTGTIFPKENAPAKPPRTTGCPASVDCVHCRAAAWYHIRSALNKMEEKKRARLQPVRADNEHW